MSPKESGSQFCTMQEEKINFICKQRKTPSISSGWLGP